MISLSIRNKAKDVYQIHVYVSLTQHYKWKKNCQGFKDIWEDTFEVCLNILELSVTILPKSLWSFLYDFLIELISVYF